MLLSTDGRTFDTLGRDMIGGRGCSEGWRYDPQRYRESMYRPGRVVLRGYLSGYTPKVGFATCMLGMEDVALRKEINHVIEIAPDGRFEIEVPVDHPSTLSLSIGPRMWDYVYVEPGDTLLCCYDLAEAADPRRARYCRDARFMGHAAPYNAYVRLLADRLPDESSADARLSGYVDRGEVPQFCAWMDTLGGRMSDSLSMLLDRYAMDDRTRDMLCTYVDQRLLYCRLDFASRYESKEKLFTRNEDGTYRVEDNPDYRPLPDSFYDFLTTDRLDNPLMIVNENFWAVVNRLEYRPVVSCFRPNGLQRQIAVRAADRVGSRYRFADGSAEPDARQSAVGAAVRFDRVRSGGCGNFRPDPGRYARVCQALPEAYERRSVRRVAEARTRPVPGCGLRAVARFRDGAI